VSKTQRERVLRALRDHPDGITAVDFAAPDVVDGGHPIMRVAARVKELRDLGAEIFADGRRNGVAIYRLHEVEPLPPPSVVSPARDTEADALFELPPVKRSPWYEDAA
jgi:hypothetical protein